MLVLLGMLFSLTSVNSKKEGSDVRRIFIDHSELENDAVRMKINRVKDMASKSFEVTLLQRDTIIDLVRLKK